MVEYFWAVICYHLGKDGQILLHDLGVIFEEEPMEIFVNESAQAGISQRFIAKV
jgi:hypothetical protein